MKRAALAGFTAGVSSVCGFVCAWLIVQHVIDQAQDGER